MEQTAEPGTTLITADTLRLAQGYIQTEDKGLVQVKGLAEPVPAHELTGADLRRTRLQVAALSGLTRFVARDAELEQLQRALDRAARGHGQVATVVGEPGVGKSRLFHEFIRSPRTQGWLVLESSSLSHDKTTPHLPLIYLLRAYFQLQDSDEPLKIHEKISGRLIALEHGLWAMMPAFLFVLGQSTDDPQWGALEPSERRRQVLEACRHLLVRESQIQPVLIALENLHWIDSETQAFLDALVESLPAARILLLVNCRPEYQHRWAGKRYYRQIQLEPLSPDAVEDLMRRLLGDDPSLRPLKHVIGSQTEGNPLFVEECVRSLVETRTLIGTHGAYRLVGDSTAIRVPATVQAILAARIDRLDTEDKGLLQAASVIGKDVPFALLRAIAGFPDDDLRRRLARLQRAELLYEARLFPDLEYAFQHALTHQVAYGSLIHDRRRLLHARIAESIERLYPDRLVELVDRLAHHALRGEMWGKAFGYLRQAGLKAMARSAYIEAATDLEQAVEAARHLPQDRRVIDELIDVRFDLRWALMALNRPRRALEHLLEAETLAETLQDRRRVGRTVGYMATCFRMLGEPARAIEHGRRALEIARNLDDFALRVAGNLFLGEAYAAAGDYPRAVEHLTWNVEQLRGELAREHFGFAVLPSVLARNFLSPALAEQGEFATARAHADEGLRIAEAAQQQLNVVVACDGLGNVYTVKGEFSTAISLLERGLHLAERLEIPGWSNTLMYRLGYAYALTGRVAEAIPLLVTSLDRIVATRGGHALACARLAEGYLLSGQIDDALRRASEALDDARRRGERGFEASTLRLLAEISGRSDPPDVETATRRYREASTLATELGMRPLVAHCHLGLSRLYQRTSERGRAKEHLATATTMYRDMGMTYWLQEAERQMASST